jgi:copper resistance protein D
MQAFLSMYSVIDWILRGASVAAQTLSVGGVVYFLFTLAPSRSGSARAALEGFCAHLVFWSAAASCVAQLLAGAALTAFLVGSTGAGLETAVSADAVSFHLISAGASLALACAARGPRISAPWALFALSLLLVGGHMGVTHAASRTEPSLSLLAAEMLHLLALATWIGGIPYFIASLRMIDDGQERRDVARRFSFTSLASVAVIGATGVFMAVPYTGSLDGLYQTTYGLLLSTKVVLLFMLLCLGATNFLAIRSRRRDKSAMLNSVSIFAEIEIGIGLIAILCAVALASSPLAVATEAARPDAAEISAHFQLVWPRLESPAYAEVSAAQPDAAVTLADPEIANRTEADIAWSEAHHHYAALVVIVTGLLALLAHSRRLRPITQHWPLLLLGLAAYLVVTADEEAWPLGKIGFFKSLTIPQIAQHKLMIALIASFAVCEWGVQSKRFKAAWPSYVFPLTIAAAAAFLLTHYGHTGRKEEVLIEVSHTPVALLGVIVASARWLELRIAPTSVSRLAGLVWPVALIAAGAFLLLYRETV